MALITTPGDPAANSYASLAEAAAYNAQRVGTASEIWDGLELAQQEAAMITAARLLDAMPQAWTGSATAAGQGRRFPRVGMFDRDGFEIPSNVVPVELKLAQCELGRQLAEADRLADNDVVNQNITSLKAGPVALAFGQRNSAGNVVVSAPTASLAGALFIPDLVKVMLVPSWLRITVEQVTAVATASAAAVVIFEVMD